jgi:hypothetical protein
MMKKTKGMKHIIIRQSRRMQIIGHIVIALGIFGLFLYYNGHFKNGGPLNLSVVLADGAITFIGVFGLMASKCLINIEDRLDRIEQGKADPK